MKPNNFPIRPTLDGSEELYTQTSGIAEKFTLNTATTYISSQISGKLEGTQYIFVAANGTPEENAAELQAAYDTLKTMSPSANNRLTLIAASGTYKFPSTFIMDTEYIDLVSLTGNRDVVFDLEGITDPYDDSDFPNVVISQCLQIDTNNVYVKGIKGKFYLSPNHLSTTGVSDIFPLPIQIGDNLPNIVVENCEGGAYSFGGDPSFGNNSITVSGTFIDCTGDNSSFGGWGIASSGTFKNCNILVDGFGSFGEIASGYFENCKGKDYSFGGAGNSSSGIASGMFINCTGNIACFGGTNASGNFTNCVSITGFGYSGSGTITGKLFYCRLTSGTFKTVSSGGRTYYCVDGNGNTNNQ